MASTIAEKITPVSALSNALAKLGPIAQHEEELARRLQHHSDVLTSFRLDEQSRVISEDDLLLARAEVAGLTVELAKTKRARRQIEADVEREREAERERISQSFDAPIQSAITDLNAALESAKAASDNLMALQHARHEKTNLPFDPLAWQEFSQRFTEWKRTVQAYGYVI